MSEVLSMRSENEIERFYMYAGDGYTVGHEEHDEGEWVRWLDHVAAREADQERIARLENRGDVYLNEVKRLEAGHAAAEKLAEAVEAFQTESWRDELASDMAAALAAFRASLSTGETD